MVTSKKKGTKASKVTSKATTKAKPVSKVSKSAKSTKASPKSSAKTPTKKAAASPKKTKSSKVTKAASKATTSAKQLPKKAEKQFSIRAETESKSEAHAQRSLKRASSTLTKKSAPVAKAPSQSKATKASTTHTTSKSAHTESPIASSPVISVDISVFNDSMMPYKFEAYHPKQGEVYMSDTQLHHFRNILETWKRELMKEVDNTISEMKGAAVLADPNDRATQEEAFNLELRTRDRERKLIRKIEEALQQIDEREYGYCESCGIEIGIRRLEARPTAGLCIDCKTLDEIRERTTQ